MLEKQKIFLSDLFVQLTKLEKNNGYRITVSAVYKDELGDFVESEQSEPLYVTSGLYTFQKINRLRLKFFLQGKFVKVAKSYKDVWLTAKQLVKFLTRFVIVAVFMDVSVLMISHFGMEQSVFRVHLVQRL